MRAYKQPLFLIALGGLLSMFSANAQQNEEELQPPTEDFIEFLLEIEDATGDGFETWLETVLDENNAQN